MIKGFLRSSPSFREVVLNSVQTLKVQRNRLEQACFRLREKDKSLFQTCINALDKNNREKAAIYANEIAEIRKLIKFLYDVELAIERVILRLETIKELSEIVIDLKPALKLLQGVSKQLLEVLPEVSTELSKVNEAISETLYSTKITTDESIIPVGNKTPGGEEIMKEVGMLLEQRLNEKLPEPPATLEIPETEKTAIKKMVALAANCSQAIGRETIEKADGESSQTLFSYKKAEIKKFSLSVERPPLEDVLLEYVKKSNGNFDVERCSADLKTSYEEVEKALESLGAKGKIRIKLKSEG